MGAIHDSIPFLDLVTPHQQLQEELVQVFRSALQTAGFIGGPMLEAFEREFAAFCGTKHCIGVSSGTDALRFALIAAGVQPGDLVITVPNTFIATPEAISQAGAHPDFVDIDERTYNMDPHKLGEYLETKCSYNSERGEMVHYRTGRVVRAVIPVHLYGQMADMDPILYIANKYNITVIEDACQAHGAEYYSTSDTCWKKAGSMGKVGAFSFYPGKNLGACGEAGAITTNDDAVASVCRSVRDHGQVKKYYHNIEGYNGRLDAIQAGFLRLKLNHLHEWNAKRRDAAARYNELFRESGAAAVPPFEPSWSKAVYHLYVIRCDNRDDLREKLNQNGISTGIHYPIPLHLQQAYVGLGHTPGKFPICENVASELLSLPMFPTLTLEQQERVVATIEQFAAHTETIPVSPVER